MFKQHIDVLTAKPGHDAGHPGEAPVYLRCPGFVAKTDAAAPGSLRADADAAFPESNRLLADSSLVGKTVRRTIRAGKPRSASLKSRSRKHCAVLCSLVHPIRWRQVERPATRHRAVGRAVGNELRGPGRSRGGARGDPATGAGGQVGVPLNAASASAATIVNGRSGAL